MTRMIRSSVFLAVCLGLWSCTSDPTADEAGVPTAIAANPTVAFVNQGASTLIKFGLMDELGGLVPSTWSIGSVSPEFTVTFDSTYRVVYNPDGTLVLPDDQSEIRVTVTGVSSGAGSFTVSASGITKTITVSVVPTDVPATFNTTTPDIGEDLVVTMPAGFALLPGATFSIAGGSAPIVVSQAADGSSATLQLAPGSSGAVTIAGITPDFAALNLTLSTTTSVTVGATSVITGEDAIATAPLVVPGGFYDLPVWGGECGSWPCVTYKLDVPAPGGYDFSLTWSNETDLGLYFLDSTFADLDDACDAHGNGSTAQPEACTVNFSAAGTYYMQVLSFGPAYGPDPEPDWVGVTWSY